MWNSVDLYSMYAEDGCFKHSRKTLKILVGYFGDVVVLLSSSGLVSILVFKKYCHFALQSADDSDNKNLTH